MSTGTVTKLATLNGSSSETPEVGTSISITQTGGEIHQTPEQIAAASSEAAAFRVAAKGLERILKAPEAGGGSPPPPVEPAIPDDGGEPPPPELTPAPPPEAVGQSLYSFPWSVEDLLGK